MSDYIPTTEEVRAAALTDYREEEITPQQFDRWLAEVKAEAWEEGWKRGWDDSFNDDLTGYPNPYRRGEN